MNAETIPELFDGSFFDGHSAAARAVRVGVGNGRLLVYGQDGDLVESSEIEQIDLSEPTQFAPCFIYLPSKATLEIANARDFTSILGKAGHASPIVAQLQKLWPISVGALGLLIGMLILGYLYGLPALAKWTAFHLPIRIEERLGEAVLEQLDEQILESSELSDERRFELRALYIDYAQTAVPGFVPNLEFRSRPGPRGINAFALPGGTIVLLDGLVEHAENDGQILGVLGHELGHVVQKHSMRQLLQLSGIALMANAIWGDFSNVVANVPLVLGTLSYSREFEREADDFARNYLLINNSSPDFLASFFEVMLRIEAKQPGKPDFLSSHPPTSERIERLRTAP